MYNENYNKKNHLNECQKINGIDDEMGNSEISHIVKNHVSAGNRKLPKTTLIFNLTSGRSCPNKGTERCQVPEESCYAIKAEKQYKNCEGYRDRQTMLWDALSAEQFAKALIEVIKRKRNPVDAIRFNEAGDVRSADDLEKLDKVAGIIQNELDINIYTYTASSWLEFDEVENIIVNASNEKAWKSGCQGRFNVVESQDEVPDDGFVCPGDCGICKACQFPGEKFEILRK